MSPPGAPKRKQKSNATLHRNTNQKKVMSDQPLLEVKKMKQPAWLKRCSPPVRCRVLERIMSDGYADDPDLWMTDMLTTAQRSPQGFVLRFGSLKKTQSKELANESLAGADLFNAPGGARKVKRRRAAKTHERTDG